MLVYAEFTGGASVLAYQTVTVPFRERIRLSTIIEQVYLLGVKSLALTNLVAVFTGMVLALQFIVGLRRFGLELYSGQVVALSVVRELGPVLTAIMMAARVGSGIAAEIGSMTVSEQVMAIRALGADPVARLVFPRVLVVTIVTPILAIIADVVGILGGMVVTMFEAGISAHFYIDQVVRTLEFEDFTSGISKTFFFGFLIGIISCYQGLKTTRGTAGVGHSTTLSVVICSVAVFVANYFLTKLFILI